MENTIPFGEILEAVDQLPINDQETLKDILTRRIIERRRDEIFEEIKSARNEFKTGQCSPTTPDELMKEIMS